MKIQTLIITSSLSTPPHTHSHKRKDTEQLHKRPRSFIQKRDGVDMPRRKLGGGVALFALSVFQTAEWKSRRDGVGLTVEKWLL
jgi:hypothetical protein